MNNDFLNLNSTPKADTLNESPQIVPAEEIVPEKIPDFVHLHVHSQFSMLDGATRITNVKHSKTKETLAIGLVQKAKTDGMSAVALTDHGNLFGAKLFYDTCRKEKIKPIIGCEVYVAREDHKARTLRSGDHLILLAKNLTGYRNLVKLVSIGYMEGFYYRPRVDKELLKKYSEGLIVSSACIAGEIPRAIMENNFEEAAKLVEWYKGVFGADFYLEIQRHPNSGTHSTEETREVYMRELQVAEGIFKLAKTHNIEVIATNDVHFLEQEDADAHEILLCLNTGKKLSDEKRLRYTRQEWFKTKKEMAQLFHDHPEVLANTVKIAEKIEDYELNSEAIMPFFPIPDDFSTEEAYRKKFSEADLIELWGEKQYHNLGGYEKVLRIKLESDYLAHLTKIGAQERWKNGVPAEVSERIDFELKTIQTMGFPGYFLIVQDFIAAARRLGVTVGPGRGSAAGCVVAYCLKITGIDPIKYDLLFERFLNPDRISMPDIDIDFDDAGRQSVLEWVTEKYGQDHVAHIVTFGVMAPRSAIKDVARVIELPLPEANNLAKLVPATPKITMVEALEAVPELRAQVNSSDPLIKRTMQLAQSLDGTVRQSGVHACGILISRNLLTDTLPIMPTEKESLPTTQYDGHFMEAIGLIKMDFLGLRTLTIIKTALANIKNAHGETIDIDNISLEDAKTFELFSNGETTALFQFESAGMRKHLMALKPNRFEDLAAMNALYRPGPMEYIPQFIRRKHSEEPITYDHPLMKTYLEETYGITVYQEQVMLLSRLLGQFTRGESDTLRKAMGKKQLDTMAQLKEKFVFGCLSNPKFMEPLGGDTKKANELCEKIWKDWEAFAKYAFNKSHAVCYAYIAYQTGWLKAHYPVEYMAAVLDAESGTPEKVLVFIGECERMGIKVLGPDVNSSKIGFAPDHKNNAIRFGFGGVKSLGSRAAEEIIAERERAGKFQSFVDFMRRMGRVRLTVASGNGETRQQNLVFGRGLQALIDTGAFDSCEIFEDRQHLLDSADAVRNSFAKEEKDASQISLFEILEDGDGNAFSEDLINRSNPPMPEAEKLKKEHELLGFYLSGHPLDAFCKLDQALTTFTGTFENCTLPHEKHTIRLCGICSDIKQKRTKDGRAFSTFTLETHFAAYDILCFGEIDGAELIEHGAVLSIDGELSYGTRKKNRAGAEPTEESVWKFWLSRIRLLKTQVPLLLKKVTLILRADNSESDAKAFLDETLLPFAQKTSGNTQLAIALPLGEDFVEADINAALSTQIDIESFKELLKTPEIAGYTIEAVPPYERPSRFPKRNA